MGGETKTSNSERGVLLMLFLSGVFISRERDRETFTWALAAFKVATPFPSLSLYLKIRDFICFQLLLLFFFFFCRFKRWVRREKCWLPNQNPFPTLPPNQTKPLYYHDYLLSSSFLNLNPKKTAHIYG